MIVSNSSPLIYLGKLKKLTLLKMLFKEVLIPQEVYEEVVVKGKEEKFLDALAVEHAKKEGWLRIGKALEEKEFEDFFAEIDRGETAAILLAQKHHANLLLIDDASARTITQSFGLKVKGTIFILLTAYKKKLLTREEVKRSMGRLVAEGFRISHELYVSVLEEIDKA